MNWFWFRILAAQGFGAAFFHIVSFPSSWSLLWVSLISFRLLFRRGFLDRCHRLCFLYSIDCQTHKPIALPTRLTSRKHGPCPLNALIRTHELILMSTDVAARWCCAFIHLPLPDASAMTSSSATQSPSQLLHDSDVTLYTTHVARQMIKPSFK